MLLTPRMGDLVTHSWIIINVHSLSRVFSQRGDDLEI